MGASAYSIIVFHCFGAVYGSQFCLNFYDFQCLHISVINCIQFRNIADKRQKGLLNCQIGAIVEQTGYRPGMTPIAATLAANGVTQGSPAIYNKLVRIKSIKRNKYQLILAPPQLALAQTVLSARIGILS
ncbi:hypothetical protein [Chitinilyticum litopenaei]|uniref:hypothetical protein n=1 Tax=Chitinilyticum litopenaei TaxID=1121276 RepID=UPI00130EE38E|nr:hypothetical protein [Chitinilyticum litopenaei]